MKTTIKIPFLYGIVLTGLCSIPLYSCNSNNENTASETASPTQAQMVEQGKYLVEASDCIDCHTPFKMTANGFVPDTSLYLSGVSQNAVTPTELDAAEMNLINSQGMIQFPDNAFAGPWGISFPANITPDSTTGIGGWTADIFIRTIRNGKYHGVLTGRDLMPPMPWQDFKNFTDEDLRAIFAYLQTIPAIHNRVPSYIPFNQLTVSHGMAVGKNQLAKQ